MAERTESVKTVHGPVRGFVDTHRVGASSTASQPRGDQPGVRKWLGIPFAQAKRWEQSHAPESWTETRDCLEFGPAPIQPPSKTLLLYQSLPGAITRDATTSEDCLQLNVFAPSRQYDRPLPVTVWVYGGSFTTGSSRVPIYDPTELVRRAEADGKPIIVVSGNHRVNAFGFVAHPDLESVNPGKPVGNFGLRDIMQMLLWVQENIGAFGGDKDRVTAFGESAGAIQLSDMLFSRQRLFNRAVLLSGAASTTPFRRVEDAAPRWQDLLDHFNIKAETPKERVEALRAIPAEDILASFADKMVLGHWGMVIESGPGAIWTSDPTASLLRSEMDPHVEAIMTGTMRDEGTLFSALLDTSGKARETHIARYPEPMRQTLEHLYPAGQADSSSLILGDSLFDGPVIHAARNIAKSGKTAVHLYRVETQASATRADAGHLGAAHSFELPLLFCASGLWNHDETSEDGRASAAIGRAFVNFAYGEEPWPRMTESSAQLNVFKKGGETELQSVDAWKPEQVAFFSSVIEKRAAM